ncbi:glycosyltransferase family 4 protein [Prosthecobacter sp.]|uniref:glycosyltransferase family 4 protein n=1 Tax=Prosthecobacter sp. TaxID=1965333 RepID=UPI002AB9DF8B|nr:glycosyltransferase family 4 protein [Prosthecobacter sp.]MDZ4404513.1 glycosyltransferase family 4 protein [Prosthecobacter sp.]
MCSIKSKRRIAIVHDWLPVYGGAERVLEQMLKVYPDADLFSLIDALDDESRKFLKGKTVKTSFVQRLPGGKKYYRHCFPLMPLAIEQFDFSGYDMVISSSYAFAKGIITGPRQLHLCYCHSPIRYAWDLQTQYLKESKLDRGLKSWLVRGLLHFIRMWDSRTAAGVDAFMANSRFISRRIEKVYRRDATVVYPPVNVERFETCREKENFYVTASRLVPYKRIDLIVQAFNAMPDRELVVIGDGPELSKLRRLAGPNVKVLGWQADEVLKDHLQRARGFVFGGEEDFGIILLEAQACGTPVIAYGRGGALETVIENETGLFFGEQNVDSLRSAIAEFETREWDALNCRLNAERFSARLFRESFQHFVEGEWERFEAYSTGVETRPAEGRCGWQQTMPEEVMIDEAAQGLGMEQMLPS